MHSQYLLDPDYIICSITYENNNKMQIELFRKIKNKNISVGYLAYQHLYNYVNENINSIGRQPNIWTIIGEVQKKSQKLKGEGLSTEPIKHYSEIYTPKSTLSKDLLMGDLIPGLNFIETEKSNLSTCNEGCGHCSTLKVSYKYDDPPLQFIREKYINEGLGDINALENISGELFPKIKFSPRFWSTFKYLDGNKEFLCRKVVHHLSVINDLALSKKNSNLAQTFAEAGVDFSDESDSVKNNEKLSRHRLSTFDGVSIHCFLHTKIQADKNRIHFAIERKNNSIFLGSMTKHYPLS